MKKTFLALIISQLLVGCAVLQSTGVTEQKPVVTKNALQKEFDTIPAPLSGKPISVAVYSFQDKTGQRRPQANVASLSTAVTQGAETFLIKALQDVGSGRWFDVVERVGIDNLTKERLIIRQMREAYEGANAKQLMPMQFAGMIIEGGIIGYDSSTNSGGLGHRFLGIGKQTQWTQDVVTISLRAVSVNTGKVLASVTVQKTILSSADSVTAFKFFDMGTKAFEAEAGLTINEPGTYAVKSAVEMAVVELIKEGQRKGIWDFKQEVKVEEKKDELVSTNTAPQGEVKDKTENLPTQQPPAQPAVRTEEPKPTIKHTDSPRKEIAPKQYIKSAYYIRKEPQDKSQRVWLLLEGTEVTVTDHDHDWALVKTRDGKKGFIRKEMLTPNKPSENK